MVGGEITDAINAIKASKRKVTRQRDNWKALALAYEAKLRAYQAWEIEIKKWHGELMEMIEAMQGKAGCK
jgi:hypothetical protein